MGDKSIVNYFVSIRFAKNNEVRTLRYRVRTSFRSRIVAFLTVQRKPGKKADWQIG